MRLLKGKKRALCPMCGARMKVQGFASFRKNKKKYICPRCDLVIKGDTCYFAPENEENLR
jgi:transposase-like protein